MQEQDTKVVRENQETGQNATQECCGGSCGCGSAENEPQQEYNDNIPLQFRLMKPGDRVVEFGSGTGNDCIAATEFVGKEGKVLGIDSSNEKIQDARKIIDNMKGVSNLEFREGSLTEAPLPKDFADVIMSSYVMNTLENKQTLVNEAYRVCDHNGYACITDLVYQIELPEGLREEGAAFSESVRGIEHFNDFMHYFEKTGFINIQIGDVKKIVMPEDLLSKYYNSEQIKRFNDPGFDEGIFSITVVAEKPTTCDPETCCCNQNKQKN